MELAPRVGVGVFISVSLILKVFKVLRLVDVVASGVVLGWFLGISDEEISQGNIITVTFYKDTC